MALFEKILESPSMIVLNEARRAVPAMNYALAVAGLAATASIVGFFVGQSKASIITLFMIFAAMVLIFIFATLIRSGSRHIFIAGLITMYAVLILFISFLAFTVTAFAFYWPPAWAKVLEIEYSTKFDIIEPPDIDDLSVIRMKNVQTADITLRDIDDIASVYLNNNVIIENAVYGQALQWYNFKQFLVHGNNDLRVFIKNGRFGGCGAKLSVKINGEPNLQLSKAWAKPMDAASIDGVCFDDVITFTVK